MYFSNKFREKDLGLTNCGICYALLDQLFDTIRVCPAPTFLCYRFNEFKRMILRLFEVDRYLCKSQLI
jgi:hypothetical protein